MTWMNWLAESVKNAVPILEAASTYGLAANQKGFVRCPFHDEDTPSLRLYEQTNTFYCFGCGVGGDVISLVCKLFVLGYRQTLIKLDQDFHLGLVVAGSDHRNMTTAVTAFREKTLREIKLQQLYRDHYRSVVSWYRYLKSHMNFHPATIADSLDPRFVLMLHQLPRIEAWLDEFLTYQRWREVYGCRMKIQ